VGPQGVGQVGFSAGDAPRQPDHIAAHLVSYQLSPVFTSATRGTERA
jgi:hypothetical protein